MASKFQRKGWLTLSLGVNSAADLKLKPMLIYHSEKTLKNDVKSTFLMLYKWNSKAWVTAHLLTTWFTEYMKPNVET